MNKIDDGKEIVEISKTGTNEKEIIVRYKKGRNKEKRGDIIYPPTPMKDSYVQIIESGIEPI